MARPTTPMKQTRTRHSQAYKDEALALAERIGVSNREFDVGRPNQVWCGDITYVCAQGRLHYLAVVLDLMFAESLDGRSPASRMQSW